MTMSRFVAPRSRLPAMRRADMVLALLFAACSTGHVVEHDQTLVMDHAVPAMVGVPRRASHIHSHKHHHHCKHNEIKEPRAKRSSVEYPSRRSSVQPIRLHFHTDSLNSTNAAQKNYILSLLEDAKAWFTTALNVVPLSGALKLSLICKDASDPCAEYYPAQCGEFYDIPASIVTTGITGSDTLIFVSATATDICADGLTLAYATACQRDQWDRPTIGWINFCPNEVQVEIAASEITHDLETAIHEITHILGFSPSSFSFFRDSDGNPRTPRCPGAAGCDGDDLDGHPPYDWDNFVYEISTSTVASRSARGRTVKELVTPEVKRLAREHFGCSTLEGAELEEFGGGGTAGSHFEKRVLHSELMIGSLGRSWTSRKSVFTLGVLQDSGWYQVNYTAADGFLFGKGQGCPFVDQQCDVAAAPWCNANLDSVCTFNRGAIGFCQVATYSTSLPSFFQYFPNPAQGGPDGLLDYCPLPTPYTNTRCDGDGAAASQCGIVSCRGEVYGADSACFESSVIIDGYVNDNSVEAACYRFRCVVPATSSASTTLQVWGADNVWHSCDGVSTVTLAGYSGSIRCPDVTEVCYDATIVQPATAAPSTGEGTTGGTPAGAIACAGTCICDAGYYNFGAYCIPCSAGTYKPSAGSGACEACPTGSSSEAGATGLSDCVCDAGLEQQGGQCVEKTSSSGDSWLFFGAAGGGCAAFLAAICAVALCRRRHAPSNKVAAAPAQTHGHAVSEVHISPTAPPSPEVVVLMGKKRLEELAFHLIVDLQWVASGGFKTVYHGQAPFEGQVFVDVALTVILRDVVGPLSRPLPAEALPRHPRLNPLIACATDPAGQLCLAAEWATCGSFYQTLSRFMAFNCLASDASLTVAAAQIAEGMSFIAAQGFVHRSLSLRSVMVSSFHPTDPRLVCAKIGDQVLAIAKHRLERSPSSGVGGSFRKTDVWADLIARRTGVPFGGFDAVSGGGSQKQLGGGSFKSQSQVLRLDTPQFGAEGMAVSKFPYGHPEGAPAPVRWLAPEVVTKGAWSEKSDAWAMGVTLCEMWSIGQDGAPADPFSTMSDDEVRKHLYKGGGHEVPERCPPGVASVIILCTEPDPAKRSSPQQAHERLLAVMDRAEKNGAKVDGAGQCVACGNVESLVALWPCGHASLCLEDAQKLDESCNVCPVCCLPIKVGKFLAPETGAGAAVLPTNQSERRAVLLEHLKANSGSQRSLRREDSTGSRLREAWGTEL